MGASWISPCDDEAEAHDALQVTIIDVHQDAENHADFCSPFCACQCCHGQTLQAVIVLTTPVTYPQNAVPATSAFHPLQLVDIIWQPPQLLV